jgi:hypothetical protein
LWADRFDRPLADLFSVQDEIVDSLASQLRGEDHEDEDDGERSDEGRSRSSCRRSYSGCPRPVKLRGQLGEPMARGAIWVSASNRRALWRLRRAALPKQIAALRSGHFLSVDGGS